MPLIHDTAHAFVPYPDAPVPHAATGPLSGLCFAAKDLFDVAGYPTGGGPPSNCWTQVRDLSAKP